MASPVLPWKTKIILTIVSAVTEAVRRSDGTINRRLIKFIEAKVPANDIPVRGVKTSDVTVDPIRNLWFRIFTPTECPQGDLNPLPVIVFFHGGGFCLVSADSKGYDVACRQLAVKFSAVIVSVNYRLAPEHRFPSQYDDGFDTLKFLDETEFEKLDFPANSDVLEFHTSLVEWLELLYHQFHIV